MAEDQYYTNGLLRGMYDNTVLFLFVSAFVCPPVSLLMRDGSDRTSINFGQHC